MAKSAARSIPILFAGFSNQGNVRGLPRNPNPRGRDRDGYDAERIVCVLMGLFSEWTLFQAPEVALERQLHANLYHPFQLASGDHNNERGIAHV